MKLPLTQTVLDMEGSSLFTYLISLPGRVNVVTLQLYEPVEGQSLTAHAAT